MSEIADQEKSGRSGAGGGIADGDPATVGLEPCLNLAGRLVSGGSTPNNQWMAYSKKYREEHGHQLCGRQVDATGIDAFRFELIEIDRAWWRMKVGEIPDVATKIWEALETELPVHLIAEDAQITTRQCVFWLKVFKRHLDLQEDAQAGRHVYSRNPEIDDLSVAVEHKVRSLH